jgi:DNA-directed RNA polymerase subunit RPC12/RpoP
MATKRLIDANDLWVDIMMLPHNGDIISSEEVEQAIKDAPTVDAVEVVHGRWEQVQRWATKARYRCSVCGREIMSAVKVNIEKYPYCHCGAKMDGDGDG